MECLTSFLMLHRGTHPCCQTLTKLRVGSTSRDALWSKEIKSFMRLMSKVKTWRPWRWRMWDDSLKQGHKHNKTTAINYSKTREVSPSCEQPKTLTAAGKAPLVQYFGGSDKHPELGRHRWVWNDDPWVCSRRRRELLRQHLKKK